MLQFRGVSTQRRVHGSDPLAVALDGEFCRLQRSAAREFGTQIGVTDNCRDRPRDLLGIVWIDEEGGISGNLRNRGFARRNDRVPRTMASRTGNPKPS